MCVIIKRRGNSASLSNAQCAVAGVAECEEGEEDDLAMNPDREDAEVAGELAQPRYHTQVSGDSAYLPFIRPGQRNFATFSLGSSLLDKSPY